MRAPPPTPACIAASDSGLAIAVCFWPASANAQEEPDILVPPEQMAESLDLALVNYRAELADLKAQIGALEDARNTVQSGIDAYVAQNTAHSQLLLESQPRLEKLENAIRNNRLAFQAMDEHMEAVRNRFDSVSILLKQTAARMELARTQIVDVQRSRLSETWKQRMESSTGTAIEILGEKKSIVEKLLKKLESLSDRMKVALEAKKAIGEKLAARLEIEKKASVFKRYAPDRGLNTKAFREEGRFIRNRVDSFFEPATWKVRWMEVKMGGFERWAIFFYGIGGDPGASRTNPDCASAAGKQVRRPGTSISPACNDPVAPLVPVSCSGNVFRVLPFVAFSSPRHRSRARPLLDLSCSSDNPLGHGLSEARVFRTADSLAVFRVHSPRTFFSTLPRNVGLRHCIGVCRGKRQSDDVAGARFALSRFSGMDRSVLARDESPLGGIAARRPSLARPETDRVGPRVDLHGYRRHPASQPARLSYSRRALVRGLERNCGAAFLGVDRA